MRVGKPGSKTVRKLEEYCYLIFSGAVTYCLCSHCYAWRYQFYGRCVVFIRVLDQFLFLYQSWQRVLNVSKKKKIQTQDSFISRVREVFIELSLSEHFLDFTSMSALRAQKNRKVFPSNPNPLSKTPEKPLNGRCGESDLPTTVSKVKNDLIWSWPLLQVAVAGSISWLVSAPL